MQQSNASTWHIMMRQCDTTNCDNATQRIATMRHHNSLRQCNATNCDIATQRIATMQCNKFLQCDTTNCDNATWQIATMRRNKLRQCDTTVCDNATQQFVADFSMILFYLVSEFSVIFVADSSVFFLLICIRFRWDFFKKWDEIECWKDIGAQNLVTPFLILTG